MSCFGGVLQTFLECIGLKASGPALSIHVKDLREDAGLLSNTHAHLDKASLLLRHSSTTLSSVETYIFYNSELERIFSNF